MKQLFIKRTLIDRLVGAEEINADINSKTIYHYRKKLKSLSDKTRLYFLTEKQKSLEPEQISFNEMAEYLAYAVKNEDFSSSYLSKFRSALLYHIYEKARAVLESGGSINTYSPIYDTVSNILVKDSFSDSKKTNSGSLKYIDEQFYEYCIEALSRMRRPSASQIALKNYLIANVQLGLRPHEWATVRPATYINGQERENMLVVDNSKHSNERANGKCRELLLGKMHDSVLNNASTLITYFSESIQHYRNHYNYSPELAKERATKNIQNKLMQSLYELIKSYIKLHPKKTDVVKGTTLYSVRHQAIANAKASDLDDIEIAALFGHVSTRTSKEYYGKKSKGHAGKFVCKTTTASMMPVIERLERKRGKPIRYYVPEINPAMPKHLWEPD